MNDDWPFDQTRNTATVTAEAVTKGEKPILLVSHYSDDHSWAFLTGEAFSMDDAQLIALQEIVNLDPTVMSIADLEPGWSAERSTVGGEWRRYEDKEV